MKDGSHVAMTRCFFCGEGNQILLHKYLRDISRYQDRVVDMTPCSTCEDYMRRGIILIGIDVAKSAPDWNKSAMPDPYRTGAFAVVTEDCARRLFNNDGGTLDWALKHRWIFIEHEVMVRTGIIAAEPEAEPAKKKSKPRKRKGATDAPDAL